MFSKILSLACLTALYAAPAVAASTLDAVVAAGTLRCGVVATPEDWSKADQHGPLAPLSMEICKAVAVAVLGEKAKVELKPYNSELETEQGLHKSEVDLAVGVTPEATAMWHWAISFGPPVFYDSQAILLRHDDDATSMKDLGGRRVCALEDTDTIKILQARTVAQGIALHPTPFQEEGEMNDALAVRHCDAVSANISRLFQIKSEYPKQLANDPILPDRLTLSPIAPAYRQGDAQWGMIVDWTVYALIQAEASGVTQANVDTQMTSEDPVVQRLLGVDWATSRALGLPARDWAAHVIRVVGNYGEIYDRTVGPHGELQMPRGLNALWLNGGLMHPLPVQ